jgi:acetylornithine deacetylase
VTGTEAGVGQRAVGLCEGLGLKVLTQPVGGHGRHNILAVDKNVVPDLLFTTHLDTVPPFIPPVDEGDRLRGRGTCDAKGAAAAMLTALHRLRASGEKRVGLLLLVGEETDSDGAKAAVQGFAPHVRWIINGEPTNLKLASAQKGTLAFRLRTVGQAAHSAYPELGRSAVHQLIDATHAIIHARWPSVEPLGETTVNIGLVSGGIAINVLAPQAEARGIFRLTVSQQDVSQQVLQLLPSDVTFERVTGTDPTQFHVPPGESAEVVPFGSDVPYLRVLGTPLMLGPGSIHHAHTAHEFVLKKDLDAAAHKYEALARQLL